MSLDWVVVTFYFIVTTSGAYWIYRRVKDFNTDKYISIDKIGEAQDLQSARKAVLDAIDKEEREDHKAITGELR